MSIIAVFPAAVGRPIESGHLPSTAKRASRVCHGKGSLFHADRKKEAKLIGVRPDSEARIIRIRNSAPLRPPPVHAGFVRTAPTRDSGTAVAYLLWQVLAEMPKP